MFWSVFSFTSKYCLNIKFVNMVWGLKATCSLIKPWNVRYWSNWQKIWNGHACHFVRVRLPNLVLKFSRVDSEKLPNKKQGLILVTLKNSMKGLIKTIFFRLSNQHDNYSATIQFYLGIQMSWALVRAAKLKIVWPSGQNLNSIFCS